MNKKKLEDIGKPKNKNKKMKAKLKEKNLEAHRLPPTRKSDVWDGPYAPPPCYCPLI